MKRTKPKFDLISAFDQKRSNPTKWYAQFLSSLPGCAVDKIMIRGICPDSGIVSISLFVVFKQHPLRKKIVRPRFHPIA
jgi:hypothetical protein